MTDRNAILDEALAALRELRAKANALITGNNDHAYYVSHGVADAIETVAALKTAGASEGRQPEPSPASREGRETMIRGAAQVPPPIPPNAEASTALTALDDHFAEIEDCLASIQGALRHRQQPQDFHFHKALKSARDGHDTVRKLRGGG